MKKLTKEQVLDILEDIPLIFDYYYKYTFTFKGDLGEGVTVLVDVGGCSDDIYRMEVSSIFEEDIKHLDFEYVRICKDNTVVSSYIE